MVKIIDSQITDIHSEMTAIGNILYQFMHNSYTYTKDKTVGKWLLCPRHSCKHLTYMNSCKPQCHI